jgi:hypothetical protein
VPSRIRSSTLGSGAKAPQRASSQQVAGKRKANELASSGESTEPANMCIAWIIVGVDCVKIKENPTYDADLAHWTTIFGQVTQHLQGHQFYNRSDSGANFCHDNCKNLAQMRQAHQGAVGLCQKMMTLM